LIVVINVNPDLYQTHIPIPLRKNRKLWKAFTAGGIFRNEALCAAKYLGLALG